MDRNTKYLRRFDEDIKELSEELELGEEETREVIDEFFIDMKSMITDSRMPTIKITNFGTFKPSIGKLNWQMRSALRAYRDGKIPRKRAVDKITHLWAIKQRLIKEKNGKNTWKDWKDA